MRSRVLQGTEQPIFILFVIMRIGVKVLGLELAQHRENAVNPHAPQGQWPTPANHLDLNPIGLSILYSVYEQNHDMH